jgi:hypothetical protein
LPATQLLGVTMKDRFDLEQEIMQCWNVVDDLKLLSEKNKLTNEHVDAIIALYTVKFETLFETFEECCAHGFQFKSNIKPTES